MGKIKLDDKHAIGNLHMWIQEAFQFDNEAAINPIKKYEIAILNHPLEHVNPDIIEIGKVAALRNTALEINRSHRNMDIETIKKLKNIGVKFSLARR